MSPQEKRCCRCGFTKAAGHFTKQARNKDGLYSWCRECKARVKRKDYKPTPKAEEALAAMPTFGALPADYAEKVAEVRSRTQLMRRWHQAHPDFVARDLQRDKHETRNWRPAGVASGIWKLGEHQRA